MAIKKLHVGFDLSVEDFARALINAGNMRIDVFGDAPAKAIKRPKAPLQLAPPKPRSRAYGIVMAHLLANKHTAFKPAEMAILLVAQGYSASTIHGTLHTLRKRGLVKRKGTSYSLTTKALTQGGTSGDQA